MKAHPSKPDPRAFTLIELIVIIITIVVIACFLIPATVRQQRRAKAKTCENNLKQVGLAFKTWTGSEDGSFPPSTSTNLGGSAELVDSGQVFVPFRAMSNELGTASLLVCPRDREKAVTTNFSSGFSDTNVSYFVSTDSKDTYPQMLLSSDRNLALNNQPLKPGLFVLTTNNTQLSWTKAIHNSCGNIAFADGSVQFTDSKALSLAAQNQGSDTNRLAIP
jgi:prepilin-type processing-associated H-X9-DG protein